MEPQNPSAPKPDTSEVPLEQPQTTPMSEPTSVTPEEVSAPSEANDMSPAVFTMDEPLKSVTPEEATEPTLVEPGTSATSTASESGAIEPTVENPITSSEAVTPVAFSEPEAPVENPTPTWQPSVEAPVVSGSVVNPAEVLPPVVPGRRISKKWMTIGLIILAVVILGGGVAAAYVGYIVPHQPKYMVARAIGNTVSNANIKTLHMDGDMTVKTSDNYVIKGSFTGASNATDGEISGSVGLDVTTLTFDTRVFGNDSAYIKIGGLNGLPQLLSKSGDMGGDILAPYISAVNGQWISIDQSMLGSLGQGKVDASTSLRVSPDDAKKIGNMYGDHPFLDVSKVHTDEMINGMSSHHYTVVINRDQLYAFGQELKNADIKNFPTISQDDLNSIKKTNFSNYPVDVWIDKSRTIIDQIKFTIKQDDNTTITVRLALGKINQPVTITKPTGAKSLMEVLGMSSSTGMNMNMGMPTGSMRATSKLNALTN